MERLAALYSHGQWRVPAMRSRGAEPFLVLVSTILSQRTRDEVTERATIRLLAALPTPKHVASASTRQVRSIIREVGLSQSKARGLVAAARFLVSEFDGKVPSGEEDLLCIPRVGPKTAHAILVFGHQLPGLPIDTHILRVTKRLGVVSPRASIPQAQRELARAVPKRYWHLLNPVLVQHGMNLCKARKPRCEECPIARWCRRVGAADQIAS